MKKVFIAALVALSTAACTTTMTAGTAEAGPKTTGGVHSLVTQVAQQHGVNPALAHAVVKVESNYNCAAKNPNSTATGAMQVLRGTARGVGVTGNLKDCRTGLEAGMRYLKQAVAKHGSGCAAATAYNQGLFTRSRCNGYGRKVMSLMGRNASYSKMASN